jgi:hypothetical protein
VVTTSGSTASGWTIHPRMLPRCWPECEDHARWSYPAG